MSRGVSVLKTVVALRLVFDHQPLRLFRPQGSVIQPPTRSIMVSAATVATLTTAADRRSNHRSSFHCERDEQYPTRPPAHTTRPPSRPPPASSNQAFPLASSGKRLNWASDSDQESSDEGGTMPPIRSDGKPVRTTTPAPTIPIQVNPFPTSQIAGPYAHAGRRG